MRADFENARMSGLVVDGGVRSSLPKVLRPVALYRRRRLALTLNLGAHW